MATIRVPYFLWRDGRPRWHPGPRLRRAGFKGRDLKDEAGQWLALEAAIAAARDLNRQVEKWRAGRGQSSTGSSRQKAPRPFRTCGELFDLWWGTGKTRPSADFAELSPKTQADYKWKGRVFLDMAIDDHAAFRDVPIASITKPHAFGVWEQLYQERGIALANAVKAVVSSAFSYAELRGWRPSGSNPWLKMNRPATPHRLAIWLPAQVDAFLEAADACEDTRSVGDTLVLGLHTAQRLSDVLTYPDRIFRGDRIMLSQLKTKALIDVKMTQQVSTRVADIRARRRDANVPAIGGTLIVNELTGQAYDANSFNKRFRLVRERAAKKLPAVDIGDAWHGPRLYELAELQFRDLRDTAVTRLALAGCTLAQIAAITGHSLQSITDIMKHYLALNRAMADQATDLLEAWLQREGIRV